MTALSRSVLWIPAAALGFAVLLSTASAQPPAAVWQQKLSSNLKSFAFSPDGTVLVQLENELFAANPETGERLWTRSDVRRFALVGGTSFAIFTSASDVSVADIDTGKDRWKYSTLGFTSIKGTIHLPRVGLLLVYGATSQSPHTLIACRYESGEKLWAQATLFPDRFEASPYSDRVLQVSYASKVEYRSWLLDGDEAIVLDASHEGLICLDLETGVPRWRLPESALASKGEAVRLRRVGRVALAAWHGGDRLFGIGLDDGKVLWSRKEKFPTPIAGLTESTLGTIVRGACKVDNQGRQVHCAPYLALLDPVSGETKWMLEKQAFKARSELLLEGGVLLAASKEAIVTYDLATGAKRNTVKMGEFEGDEDPQWLERAPDGGLLVASSQTLRKFDASGKPTYSVYLHAPGPGFAAKLATIGFAVGMGALFVAPTVSELPDLFTPPLRFLGPTIVALEAYSTWEVVSEALALSPGATKRTTNAARFTYVFTEERGGHEPRFALVRIDKETGEDTGRLRFRDRSPGFGLDPASGIVVAEHDGVLAAFRFPPADAGK